MNKESKAAYDKKYYEENIEVIREQKKKYYKENKEALRERQKKYYKENKEAIAAYGKKYREENIEVIRERKKKYREENIEALRERDKKYYKENIEAIAAYGKKYHEENNNPNSDKFFKYRLRGLKNRAKSGGKEFNLDEEYLRTIYPEDGKCPALGIKFKLGKRDHIPSLDRIDNSKGYVKGNVQWVSVKANCIMHNATPEEVMKVAKHFLEVR